LMLCASFELAGGGARRERRQHDARSCRQPTPPPPLRPARALHPTPPPPLLQRYHSCPIYPPPLQRCNLLPVADPLPPPPPPLLLPPLPPVLLSRASLACSVDPVRHRPCPERGPCTVRCTGGCSSAAGQPPTGRPNRQTTPNRQLRRLHVSRLRDRLPPPRSRSMSRPALLHLDLHLRRSMFCQFAFSTDM
jgi:hypothetical protein